MTSEPPMCLPFAPERVEPLVSLTARTGGDVKLIGKARSCVWCGSFGSEKAGGDDASLGGHFSSSACFSLR